MVTFAAFSALCLLPFSIAHPLDHQHVERRSLLQTLGASSWHHEDSHPVNKLFRRQTNTTSPAVGTPEWAAKYPAANPDVTKMPDEWKQALAKATAAGLIPNVTLSKAGVYPSGVDATSPTVCNSASDCRAEGDIWDAPDGILGVSFDDGPTPASPRLYDFLKANNQKATHFFIGVNILASPQIFLQAFQNGNDIASHTWTHRWSTSLTNEELVAEFGWSLQISADLTGGRVPKYWRPPYGDSDNRVRAIAKHIFGLTQVDWNQDTDDWELPEGKVTMASIAANLSKWITGPKHPGLIILEHELLNETVQAFIDAYPLMKSNGWNTLSIPDMAQTPYYQNAKDNTAPVVALNVAAGGATTIDLSGTSTSTSVAASTAAPSASSSPQNTNSNKPNAATPVAIVTGSMLWTVLSVTVAALFWS
ncbi:hypothetical protein FRB99_007716 [Tulasnella sp. 403]|nr:hypothetical protein FRB99_007716 [Tulasnella sp. 403]